MDPIRWLSACRALFILACPMAGIAQVPGDERSASTRTLQSVPVAALIGGGDSVLEPPPLGSLLDWRRGEGATLLDWRESTRRIGEGQLVDLLRSVLAAASPPAAESDDLEMFIDGGRLVLKGRPEQSARAIAVVEHLESSWLRQVRITARLDDAVGGSGEAVRLTSTEAASVFGVADSGRWSAEQWVGPGAIAGLEQVRAEHYVSGELAEVAEKASVVAPTISTLFDGVSLRVQVHAVPGSRDLVLMGALVVGERAREFGARRSEVEGAGVQDVPCLFNQQVTFSGRVEDGGALRVFVSGDAGAGSSFVLSLRAVREAEAPGAGADVGLTVVPVSALTTASLAAMVKRSVRGMPGVSPLVDLAVDRVGAAAGLWQSLDAGRMSELATDVVYGAFDAGRVSIRSGDGALFVIGDAEPRRAVEAALATLHDQWLETVDVTLETSARLRGDPEASPVGSAGPAATILHRIRAPMLVGRNHLALRGVESTAIQAVNVEIAAKSTAIAPVTQLTFDGVFANIVPLPGVRRARVQADIEVLTVSPLRERLLETELGGKLYLPSVGRRRIEHRGAMPEGERLDLGDAGRRTGADGRVWRLGQSLAVRALRGD